MEQMEPMDGIMEQSQSTSAYQPENSEPGAMASIPTALLLQQCRVQIEEVEARKDDDEKFLIELRAWKVQYRLRQQNQQETLKRLNEERAKSRDEIKALRRDLNLRNTELKRLQSIVSNGKAQLLNYDSFEATDEVHQLRKQLEEQKMVVTCTICMTARYSTVFQCGHLSCDDCSDRLHQCHVCRLPILQRSRVFL